MEPHSLIPSHRIAEWLLGVVDSTLKLLGLSRQRTLEEIIYSALIIVFAVVVGWLVRRGILWACRKLLKVKKSEIAQELLRQRVFSKCSHIIPPLIFMALIPFAFQSDHTVLRIIDRLILIYLMLAIGVALSSIMTFIWTRYDTHENTVNHPLRGVLNIGKGVLWIIITILSVSIIVDKSPAYLLTGLGAFAAALMLIFKDSILGFVAGIQLSQNDMLRVGDWIVVPSTPADGVVVDVTLSVVKVINFDNTMVMLPPYTLVSTSFQNWRGMYTSGMRRIARELYFDMTSIRPLADGEAAKLAAQFTELKDFVARDKTIFDPGKAAVNGTMETNLGLFRAYVCQYLINNDAVSNDGQILVRLMQPESYGQPLEIYCFTATTKWTEYEAIQSAIFEHLIAVAPQFGLTVYNRLDAATFKAGPQN